MSAPITIPASLDGERIDRVVALLSELPRTEVTALVARGAVRVGGTPVTVRHRRVRAGEVLEFDLPARTPDALLAPAAPGTVNFRVVYEDDALIVIDKPAGLVVHPGAGHREDTLAAGLLAAFPDLADAARAGTLDPERPGIVHRLDKDTSGLLVVARTPAAYAALSAQLAKRTMGRSYRALALGGFEEDSGVIEAPIGRSNRSPTRMAVTAAGKPARTAYRVEARYRAPITATLLEVSLETGRTHQIRVHLAAIGHPVAGDARYRGPARALGLTRPFLHAARLRLVHPETGATCEFTSPLAPDLEEALARLS